MTLHVNHNWPRCTHPFVLTITSASLLPLNGHLHLQNMPKKLGRVSRQFYFHTLCIFPLVWFILLLLSNKSLIFLKRMWNWYDIILKCLLIKIIEFLFYDILNSGRSNIQMLIRSSNQTGTGVTFETRAYQYKLV